MGLGRRSPLSGDIADPVPLRYQFEAEYPDSFAWEHVHNRPEDVAVKITKVKLVVGGLPKATAGSCGHH